MIGLYVFNRIYGIYGLVFDFGQNYQNRKPVLSFFLISQWKGKSNKKVCFLKLPNLEQIKNAAVSLYGLSIIIFLEIKILVFIGALIA